MQVELSKRSLTLLHKVTVLFKKEIPSYNTSTTQLVNKLVEECCQSIIDDKKKK